VDELRETLHRRVGIDEKDRLTQRLQRAQEPGEGNARWLEGQKEYYQGVEADIYQVLVRRATEVGPEVELNDLLACDNFDVMDRVQEIQLPTQVGSEDMMTPVKYSDYLAHKIKHAREEVIPGAGHFVQLQRYQVVNEQIERFMATLK